MSNRPAEYDKPAERLAIGLENHIARLLNEAAQLELIALRLRTEAARSGGLARAYGTLPARRLRPMTDPIATQQNAAPESPEAA